MDKWKEWIKCNFSKVKFYDKILWEKYLSFLGISSSLVTLLSFFATAKDLKINITWVIVLFIAFLIYNFMRMWWKANHQSIAKFKINNTRVRIQEGNIFELLQREPEERNGELSVIAVNDYYDTIIDDRIIAKKSLHGQYISQIDKEGKLARLNEIIENDELLNSANNREDVPSRKKGRKVRYSIGSVVEFEAYVLAAFTKFDDNNKAYLSAEEYTRFWMRFWENIDEIYAGRTLHIPLIGAGIARFRNGKPSKQELLEVMLWTLKISGFHNTYGDKEINIVIYKSDIPDIDFYHIQHNHMFR